MLLSKVLKILDWEDGCGIYLSINRKPPIWVTREELRTKYDWSKYEVVKITKKFTYSFDNEDRDFQLNLKTIK